ncbi:MAG: ROK family glucokinase [Eubacterium sp.]|nr:ROK family glucokinase [Eubacterium sp.]
MKKYLIGVDIGGMSVKYGLFDLEGNIVSKWSTKTDISDGGGSILPDIAASIIENLSMLCIDNSAVLGIGLGVPGAVCEGGVAKNCPNINWDCVECEKILSQMTQLKVFAANDANLAALGECWKGAGGKYKSIVTVTLGTGIGGGIVIDGKLLRGAHGGGGEIGHLPVNPDETEECGCGKKGCFEQYASASGIVRLAKKRLKEDDEKSVLRDMEVLSAKDVTDAAKSNDKVAKEVMETVFEYLGRGLAMVSCAADPEAFVIGGGVSGAGDYLLDNIKKYYLKYAFTPQKDAEFKIALLGNDAGIIGGAKLVLDNVSEVSESEPKEEEKSISAEDVLSRIGSLKSGNHNTELSKALYGLGFLLGKEDERTEDISDIYQKLKDLKLNPVVNGALNGDVNVLLNEDIISFTREKFGQSLVVAANVNDMKKEFMLPGQMLYIWLNSQKKVDISDNKVALEPYQLVVLEFYPGDELPG